MLEHFFCSMYCKACTKKDDTQKNAANYIKTEKFKHKLKANN